MGLMNENHYVAKNNSRELEYKFCLSLIVATIWISLMDNSPAGLDVHLHLYFKYCLTLLPQLYFSFISSQTDVCIALNDSKLNGMFHCIQNCIFSQDRLLCVSRMASYVWQHTVSETACCKSTFLFLGACTTFLRCSRKKM